MSDRTAPSPEAAPLHSERPPRSERPRDGRSRPDRPRKRDVHGWVVLDKGVGMTSTHAVAVVKRALSARKAGHAGTLDPLASGILPIALGEGTKTVPFVMDGRKAYRFAVTWGIETDTDDTEGRIVERSDLRPEAAAVEALLPRFTGEILQTPPRFSAIKIGGERAYDLARDGEAVELQPRRVEIDRLTLVEHRDGVSLFEAECGKGTYVRALARDMGRALGCLGHISQLRRTRVGPFTEADAVTVADLEAATAGTGSAEGAENQAPDLSRIVRPVQTALGDLAQIPVSRDAASRLLRGQSVILRGRDAPLEGPVYATLNGVLVSVGQVDHGEFVPHRVFNLGA